MRSCEESEDHGYLMQKRSGLVHAALAILVLATSQTKEDLGQVARHWCQAIQFWRVCRALIGQRIG